LGNPAVATGENVASIALTLIAILIPFLSAFVVILLVALLARINRKKGKTNQKKEAD